MTREGKIIGDDNMRPLISLAAVFTLLATLSLACSKQRTEQRWIDEVRLEGVESIDEGDLQDGLATRPTSCFWWLPFFFEKTWFERSALDLDIKRIEAYYAHHGFFRAKVVEHSVLPEEGGEQVDVAFKITEGEPTKVVAVDIEGLEELPEDVRENMRRDLALRTGNIFRSADFERDRGAIEARLRRQGYAYAKVEGHTEVDRDQQTARIEIQVEPGPLVRFGETLFAGNGDIPADKLRSLITWDEGERYDENEVRKTRAKLLKERLFSSVRIELPDAPMAHAPLSIELAPTKLRELRLGLGVGVERRQQEIMLQGRWIWRNFLGGMRTLRVRLEPAFVAQPTVWDSERMGPAVESDVKLTQPDIFGSGILAYVVNGYDLGIHEGYQYHGPRASLGLERSFFDDYLQVGLSWNLWFLDFFSIDQEAYDTADSRLGLGFTDPYRLAYLEEFLIVDIRDSFLNPTLGGFLETRAEQGFPQIGGDFTYFKVVPDLRGYLPLGTQRVVLAQRAQFGWIWTAFGSDAPVTRRLFLGGPTSHRGFTFNRLAPQTEAADGNRIPVGGTGSVLLSTDLRISLFKLGGNWLNLNLFFDAGDAVSPTEKLDLSLLHLAVGASLAYQTPIGALRLGIGVRLNRLGEQTADRNNPDPGERIAFHLTLGEAF